MLGPAVFDPLSLVVLALVLVMVGVAMAWWSVARRQLDALQGGLQMLRGVGRTLPDDHPIRRRLETAPVVDLSFEEIARLMSGEGEKVQPAIRTLVHLRGRLAWVERFAQLAIHFGILGTVFALVMSDPTDLEGFRARLPMALGTTFWGLIGAVGLSAIAGGCEAVLERASGLVREALLEGFDAP
jgi:nitrogen fixation-related uncharacterized protein